MGHLFRMLNFAKYLKQKGQDVLFLINSNEKTQEILTANKCKFEVVLLDDESSCWEAKLIDRHGFTHWINDRLNTSEAHLCNILTKGVKTITFDDLGSGSKYCDINICGLFFSQKNLQGKKVLRGVEYLILNPDINLYKRQRTSLNNILVTLGGSDTYGVTIDVLKILKKHSIKATIHTGPSFKHQEELGKELTDDFKVVNFMPSLIKEFSKYDLIITGGGITPFEANASGLPCLIIANEQFEVPNGEYLHKIGSSIFLGFYKNIDEDMFKSISQLDLTQMSKNGLLKLDTSAIEKIYKEVMIL
ncbi:hypothetical protein U5B43_04755 [Campylobacter sp. 9BO]|uniref:hypothetical protein n=1 Tax=Campylobacter sp. 9BO TaxID=3424759 RepID=UPI003D34FB1A